MCLIMPAKVIESPDPVTRIGRVDAGGARWQVNLALLDEVSVGDWVLVQMGIGVRKVDDATAQEMLDLIAALQSPSAPGRAGEAPGRDR